MPFTLNEHVCFIKNKISITVMHGFILLSEVKSLNICLYPAEVIWGHKRYEVGERNNCLFLERAWHRKVQTIIWI